MNWYYVDGGQQAGPVGDAEFEALVQRGKVQADTLVWHEGLANWQPYREVKPPGLALASAPPISAAPGGAVSGGAEAVCAECGKIFSTSEMIQYGDARVCANCKPIFVQKLSEGAPVGEAMNYAGFWIRFAAKFVDGLIIGIVFLAPLFVLGFAAATSGNPNRFDTVQIFLQLGYYVANLFYSIFFVGKFGATPGKMLCKLKVVNADGAKIGYGRATGRYFAEILSGLICNIGYIMAAFDDEKRALHDRICNTRVVYK